MTVRRHSFSAFMAPGVLCILLACGGSTPESPAVESQLAFLTQPANTPAGRAFPLIQVEVENPAGNRLITASDPITLTIRNSKGTASLSGTSTMSPIQGVATFNNAWTRVPDSGYMLVASAGPMATGTSAAFTVMPNPAIESPIATGDHHTCWVASPTATYCWGSNASGQLGDGTMTNRLRPVLVQGGVSFVSVVAGNAHTCALTAAGAAYCWGNNSYGQLATGHIDTIFNSSVPLPIAGGLTFVMLAAGGSQTCGVTGSGAAYCWGNSSAGQLGNGTTNVSNPPVPQAVTGGLTFGTVTSGFASVCGLTVQGAAYCWGSGPVGDGTTSSRSRPVEVVGGLIFEWVTDGCGLTGAGSVYCWGVSPALAVADPGFVALSINIARCGITATGAAYCWGQNGDGRLGDGTTTDEANPVPVGGGLTFRSISADAQTCGVALSGAAYCWGGNRDGQVGDGDTVAVDVPTQVVP